MLESELHLFVFEGDKTEDKILKSLERHFFGKRFTVKCVYDAEIYQLYKQLVNDDFVIPNQRISQMEVFEKQMEKHILRKCPRVAVLSAFPIFVLDYYGCDNINDKFLYCHCDGREILEKSK